MDKEFLLYWSVNNSNNPLPQWRRLQIKKELYLES